MAWQLVPSQQAWTVAAAASRVADLARETGSVELPVFLVIPNRRRPLSTIFAEADTSSN